VEANSTNSKSSCSTSGITASFLSIFSYMADEQEDIEAYINTLEIGRPLDVEEIKQGYEHFKHRHNKEPLNALGFKSPNKLVFGHCLFARLLCSVIRNQGHNVIIIHHRGGKQHKFKHDCC
jgi:hypothetical protein